MRGAVEPAIQREAGQEPVLNDPSASYGGFNEADLSARASSIR
jgi:hypothetical protein